MKTLLCLLAAALLCGCKPAAPVKSEAEKMSEHLHELLAEECTNEIPGINKIVSSYVDYDPQTDITNWHAGATLDFVNHFGGIDRTNLHLAFSRLAAEWSTNIYCHLDYDWYLQAELAKFHRDMENAGK